MKTVSGREFARLLEHNGWKLARIKGSHHVYSKAGRVERLSVPVHGNKPLKIGLLKHFLKVAGLEDSILD